MCDMCGDCASQGRTLIDAYDHMHYLAKCMEQCLGSHCEASSYIAYMRRVTTVVPISQNDPNFNPTESPQALGVTACLCNSAFMA